MAHLCIDFVNGFHFPPKMSREEVLYRKVSVPHAMELNLVKLLICSGIFVHVVVIA